MMAIIARQMLGQMLGQMRDFYYFDIFGVQ